MEMRLSDGIEDEDEVVVLNEGNRDKFEVEDNEQGEAEGAETDGSGPSESSYQSGDYVEVRRNLFEV